MARGAAQKKTTDMRSMMEIYQELAIPGVPHKLLAGMAGSWSVRGLCAMEPDQPPVEHVGTSEQRMIFDGRFLQQEFSGEMMGSPFSGIGFTGYDNQSGKYVSTWMDTMGTGIYYFEGTAGPDGRTITQTCSYDDPVRGPVTWRNVTRIVDDNTLEIEMFSIDQSGTEEKMAQMTYSRRN